MRHYVSFFQILNLNKMTKLEVIKTALDEVFQMYDDLQPYTGSVKHINKYHTKEISSPTPFTLYDAWALPFNVDKDDVLFGTWFNDDTQAMCLWFEWFGFDWIDYDHPNYKDYFILSKVGFSGFRYNEIHKALIKAGFKYEKLGTGEYNKHLTDEDKQNFLTRNYAAIERICSNYTK